MAKGPQIFGIYQIRSISKNRIYIGCSNDIHRRWVTHKSLLKNNKHSNPFLQNHYNSYGPEDLIFSILESYDNLSYSDLLLKEKIYIDQFKTFGYGNFNMTAGGDSCSDVLKQSCKIQNIFSLEVKEFESVVEAANFIGIDRSSMSKILKGKKKQMKGWCSAELGYDRSELDRKNRVLYHKDHGEVKVGENMCFFARQYNLNPTFIHRLFTKANRNLSHKGWTTYDPKIEKRIHMKHRRVACYDKEKNLIKEFDFIADAAREYNCSASSIHQALKEPFVKTSMKLYWDYLK